MTKERIWTLFRLSWWSRHQALKTNLSMLWFKLMQVIFFLIVTIKSSTNFKLEVNKRLFKTQCSVASKWWNLSIDNLPKSSCSWAWHSSAPACFDIWIFSSIQMLYAQIARCFYSFPYIKEFKSEHHDVKVNDNILELIKISWSP